MTEVLNILEVNNIDLKGRRFNGYDIKNHINNKTKHSAKQIVVYKSTVDKDVLAFFYSYKNIKLFKYLGLFEQDVLSVHSQLSITSPALMANKYYEQADLVHYHLIHNTKLSLQSLEHLLNEKPSVVSFHDPWLLTGRCVQPQECEKWKTGCKDCEYLYTEFSLPKDTCKYLWEIKSKVYAATDPDIIVSTKFMYDMLKESPLTGHIKNVHIIPFGINLDYFSNRLDKKAVRDYFSIPQDHIVLFLRAQKEFKGVEYIEEALEKTSFNKKITVLTCDGKGLFENIKGRYNVIEYGEMDTETIVKAFNACDIFLMPSIGESFGMMAVEAMACEKPVIIFDNTALPVTTFAPECGVLVENKNANKLAEAIKWMVEDEEERIRRGKLGRELAEKHYDVNVYNKKIVEVYEKAYERQISKIKKISLPDINYENENVRKLIPELKKLLRVKSPIYKKKIKVLDNVVLSSEQNSGEIDYSDKEVQNLLMHFNNEMYTIVKKREPFTDKFYIMRMKINKLIWLYNNDRKQFFRKIGKIFDKNPTSYRLARRIYKTLRKIKHILKLKF
jgi:glycosyltransferase involved in cell wall biosynthesis